MMININFDDAKVGTGNRRLVVIRVGPRRVECLYPATLARIMVDRKEFDRYARQVKFNPRFVAKLIRRNRRDRRRLGLGFPDKTVKAALAAIEAEA